MYYRCSSCAAFHLVSCSITGSGRLYVAVGYIGTYLDIAVLIMAASYASKYEQLMADSPEPPKPEIRLFILVCDFKVQRNTKAAGVRICKAESDTSK